VTARARAISASASYSGPVISPILSAILQVGRGERCVREKRGPRLIPFSVAHSASGGRGREDSVHSGMQRATVPLLGERILRSLGATISSRSSRSHVGTRREATSRALMIRRRCS